MKKLVAFLIPLIGCSTAAFAQDATAESRWEGAYGGVHIGGSWLNGAMTAYTPYNSYNGFSVADLNNGNFSGGAQLGYNHQMGSVGIGAEAMMSFTDIDRASTTNNPGSLFWRKASMTATVAPRLSYATPSMIFYAKGGLAIARFEVGHDQNGTDIVASDTQTGYVLGAGAEYALTPRISAGVQYDYMNFGNAVTHVVSPASDIDIAQGGKIHSARLVVNYRF